MTDDLPRDLEDVASSVPAMPNDYAYLRSLIQSLPSPLAPELRSAQAGVTASADPEAAAAKMAASMIGGAPGTESGATSGRYPEVFYGQSNALEDPTLETLPLGSYPQVIAEGSAWTACGPYWRARKTLTSGTNPTVEVSEAGDRDSALYWGSGSSALAKIVIKPASAPFVTVVEMRTTYSWSPAYQSTVLTNIISAVRVRDYNGAQTGCSYVVEIQLVSSGGVVQASTSLTSTVLQASQAVLRRMSCAHADTVDNLTAEDWWLNIKVTATYTGSAGLHQGVFLSEPQMSFSSTEQPPPFMPAVASWKPRQLTGRTANIEPIDASTSYMGWWDVRGDYPSGEAALRLRLAADTHGRVVVGLTNGFGSGIAFGPGGTTWPDVQLYRVGSYSLETDSSFAADGQLGVGGQHTRGTMQTRSTAEFWCNYKSLVTIGDSAHDDGNPVLSFWRTAAGYESGRGMRIGMPSSTRGLIVQHSSGGDTAYGSETWTTDVEFATDGKLAFGPEGSQDTNIYRRTANVLRTDDYFESGLGIDYSYNVWRQGVQILDARRTGWGVPTTTDSRATFSDSVTLQELARRVGALIDDLVAHGLIGA